MQAVKPAVVNVRVERTDARRGRPGRARWPPTWTPRCAASSSASSASQGQGPGRCRRRSRRSRQRGEGSGFIIGADGLIVTNAHVAGGADKITVLLDDGTELPATLKGIDEKTDLALLKVEAGKPLPYVTFGDSSKVRVGDAVVAVGNPFGLGGTVTSGIVSATGREIGSGPYDDFLQIDARSIAAIRAARPSTSRARSSASTRRSSRRRAAASASASRSPRTSPSRSIADLQDDGKVERGWLGVQIQGLDEDLAANLELDKPRGALVSEVQPDSPAEAAGVKQGDVILAFAGKPIERVGQLSRAVAVVEPGKQGRDRGLARRQGGEAGRPRSAPMPTRSRSRPAEPAKPSADQPQAGPGPGALTPEQREQLGLDADAAGRAGDPGRCPAARPRPRASSPAT